MNALELDSSNDQITSLQSVELPERLISRLKGVMRLAVLVIYMAKTPSDNAQKLGPPSESWVRACYALDDYLR